MRPIFEVIMAGNNLTELLKVRNASISLTSQAGTTSDTVSISFDAGDGKLLPYADIPAQSVGTVSIDLEVSLGYEKGENMETPYPLTVMGGYVVEDCRLNGGKGSGNRMSISAKGVSMGRSFKKAQNWEYHNQNLKQIVTEICARQTPPLTPHISSAVGARYVRHIDQRGLSDMSFLTKLALSNGCDVKVLKNKDLYFGTAGNLVNELSMGPKASNREFTLDQEMCSDWTFTGQARGKYKYVVAKYYDKDKGVADNVVLEVKKPDPGVEAVYELVRAYPSKAEATQAAKGKLIFLDTNLKTFTFEIGGCPLLLAESIITLKDWYPGVPSIWHVQHVTHVLDKNGYRTNAECQHNPALDAQAKS